MKKNFITVIALLHFVLFTINTNAQIINTVAGQGGYYYNGYAGDSGPATSALLYNPSDVTIDKWGNMYIVDQYNHVIRKVTPAGIINTIAGNHIPGYSGDGGPATGAQFNYPSSVVADTLGNIYIADPNNYVIRKVNAAGIITTFAGSNVAGNSGDGGPATQAQFYINYLGIDKKGNIYFTDSYNHVVRKINTLGIITTIAGTGVSGFSGDGGPATAAKLNRPISVCADTAGNIYIGDDGNYRVRKINTAGIISTIAGTGVYGNTGDGGPAISAGLYSSAYVKVDLHGNIYICEGVGHQIRKINSSGIINAFAGDNNYNYTGDGGPAILATFFDPAGIALDSANNLYVADKSNNAIRKISYCPAPMPPVHVSGNPNFCGGTSEILTATGATTYSWSAAAGSATTSTVSISPALPTTYFVFSSNSGCITFDSMTVNILPLLSIAGTTTVCAGDSNLFVASGALTYTWSSNAGNVHNDSVKVAPTANAVYTVWATSPAGCKNSDSISVVVDPKTTTTFVNAGFSSPVCVNAGPHTIFGAYPPGGTYSGIGVSGNTFNPTGADTGNIVLSYTYVNSYHCASVATHSVQVNVCSGIEQYLNENSISVFPNPANGQFYIEANTAEKLTVDLYDLNGRHVLNKTVNDRSYIDVAELNEGIYFLSIKSAGHISNKKLTVIR